MGGYVIVLVLLTMDSQWRLHAVSCDLCGGSDWLIGKEGTLAVYLECVPP